jgi:hypothetical protein
VAAGCTRICREKVTGAPADRRELLKMRGRLAAADLGDGDANRPKARPTSTCYAVVKRIVNAKAQFRSQAEPGVIPAPASGG